jgi:hypothetical protein
LSFSGSRNGRTADHENLNIGNTHSGVIVEGVKTTSSREYV